MASLFRQQSTTYAIIDAAGQAKYRDADGNRVRRATPGSVKIKTKSPIWSGRYFDAGGIQRQVPLCANKTVARAMLNELEVTAKQTQRGMAANYEKPGNMPLF